MNPAPWSRLDDLLDGALARRPPERRSYLDEACSGDASLRDRLQELLDIAEADDGDLRPGGGLESFLAAEVLDEIVGEAREVPLPPGTRLGRFEVKRFLGAGSMGRVYRALDPTLGREVAIKALAQAFRADGDALRRFEREARVLATINHPNVAAIHGLEVVDGAPYLVLELVEGETLEERLSRGPMSAEDAVAVARQIAEALEEAHRVGVVHRDLKPANIKLTGPGQVKVLDFGLARAIPAAAGTLTEIPPTVTTAGVIQGTAPYMSPEQARGETADARSDVWAFGCVLYEMLAGRRTFAGRTVADVLASVMRDDVDWTALPAGLRPALGKLIERCLRRDPRQRLQHIGDARLELAELSAADPRWAIDSSPRPSPRPLLRFGPWLLAAGLMAGFLPRKPATQPPGRALQLTLPMPAGIDLAPDFSAPFALSPDASTLVFLGKEAAGLQRLYVRALGELTARPLAGTEGAWQPFFSPDGRWVAFFADLKLKKVALAGGEPIPLVEVGAKPRGGYWGADGTIVLARSWRSGLSRVSAEGGPLEELTRLDFAREERAHRWPQLLPGGQAVLFTVDHEGHDIEDATIEALSLRTGERRVVLKGGNYARFLPPRHLVYANEGRLFAVGFDPERLALEGTPTAVLEGVGVGPQTGAAQIAIADDGTLVYLPGLPPARDRHLAWMDLAGRRTQLPGPPRRFREPRLDPRGRRVAVRIGPVDEAEVWTQDLASGTLSQLTFDLRPWSPIWTRDGKHLTVGAQSGGRWRLLSLPVAGGPPQVLHEGPFRLYPSDWSPDGRFLAFEELHPERGWDIAVLEVDAVGRPVGPPQPLAATRAHETHAAFSPDGCWIAYESDALDATVGVYAAPFGRPGAHVIASREAGRWPVWGGPGELFYWRPFPSELRRVSWSVEAAAFHVSDDDLAVSSAAMPALKSPSPPFDYSPSARKFLFLEGPRRDPPAPRVMTLFVGWGEDVRRRLAP